VDERSALRALALDRHARAHAGVDQVAVREAHVCLERGPSRGRDAVAQRRYRRGHRVRPRARARFRPSRAARSTRSPRASRRAGGRRPRRG
jgi:hypothetical protein